MAAKETVASTRTIGNMAEAFVMNIQQRGNDGALDRVLDAPTNEAWIQPWVQHAAQAAACGSTSGQRVEALRDGAAGACGSATVRDRRGRRRRIDADWFVCAMPAERIAPLLSPLAAGRRPGLEGIRELQVDWMAGIQFYLPKQIDITHGHVTFVDAPWALTSLTQAQFWAERDFPRDYGDGTRRSTACRWTSPTGTRRGILYKKPAKRCTQAEIEREVWAPDQRAPQGHRSGDPARRARTRAFLDPGIAWDKRRRRNRNATPLLVNTVGSWDKRPKARTKIPNLFLSGDYVQTDIDLATMEGANESGRAAVAALLDAAGSNAAKPKMYKLYDPPEFEAAKRADSSCTPRACRTRWTSPESK